MNTSVRLAFVALMGATAVFASAATSGPQKGQFLNAFEPTHVTGPDKGTQTCPVCKYGARPAVQVWVNNDSFENVGKIASALESEIDKKGANKLKVFVVFINPTKLSDKEISTKLEKLAEKNHLKNVALTYLPGAEANPVKEYQINTSKSVKNTVLVYSDRKVKSNFVNLEASQNGLNSLKTAVEAITAG